MALKRSEIKRPSQPAEAVASELLGGEVIVRAAGLSDHLRLIAEASKDGGKDRFSHICRALEVTVLDADKQPIFTADEWDAFGATAAGQAEAYRLFDISERLRGKGDPSGN